MIKYRWIRKFLLIAIPLLGVEVAMSQGTSFSTMQEYAESGDVNAQLLVGLSYAIGEYRDGTAVDIDYALAVDWIRQAAEGGHSYAQWYLGGMYSQGVGVDQSDEQAVQWYLRAAKSGNIQARTNLAIAYLRGTGIEKDAHEAYAWASLASFQGSQNAAAVVQEVLQEIDDRDEADQLALEYFEEYGVTDPYSE